MQVEDHHHKAAGNKTKLSSPDPRNSKEIYTRLSHVLMAERRWEYGTWYSDVHSQSANKMTFTDFVDQWYLYFLYSEKALVRNEAAWLELNMEHWHFQAHAMEQT